MTWAPLKPSSASKCCVELVKGYIELMGRPNDWLYPGRRVALYCEECKARILFTKEEGWQRDAT